MPGAPDPKVLKTSPAGEDVEDRDFLAALGRRVRQLREQRGMARKVLSRQSSISERYIAQLEAGEGNISIVLLRRVVAALGVPLTELLDEQDAPVEHRLIRSFLEQLPARRLEEVVLRLRTELGAEEAARSGRIALIGLRGAGKSTLGRMLAASAKLPFVELDEEIEREAGLSLSEVFLLYGQAGYRRLERRSLQRIVDSGQRCIVSVGGGIVSETNTYKLLLSKCFTVWLRATPEEHMARVVAQGDARPMAGNDEAMDDLRHILAAREPLYSRADAIVDTSGQTAEASLALLNDALRALLPETM
jgi:XRE family aerobic/anaerobic benzoate catabolism transcriptional regulator